MSFQAQPGFQPISDEEDELFVRLTLSVGKASPPPYEATPPGGLGHEADDRSNVTNNYWNTILITGKVVWFVVVFLLFVVDFFDGDGDAVVMLRGGIGSVKAIVALA